MPRFDQMPDVGVTRFGQMLEGEVVSQWFDWHEIRKHLPPPKLGYPSALILNGMILMSSDLASGHCYQRTTCEGQHCDYTGAISLSILNPSLLHKRVVLIILCSYVEWAIYIIKMACADREQNF